VLPISQLILHARGTIPLIRLPDTAFGVHAVSLPQATHHAVTLVPPG
jgi:hypothetical protein